MNAPRPIALEGSAAARLAEFRAHRDQLLRTRVLWGSGLATVLLPLSMVNDHHVPPAVLAQVSPARWVTILLFGAIFCATRWGSPRLATALSFALTFVGGFGSLYMSHIAGDVGASQYGRTILVILCCGLLFPWRGWEMALACVALDASFAAVVAAYPPMPATFAEHMYLLSCTAIIASIGSELAFRLRRQEFVARSELEARTRELDEKSAELAASVARLQDVDRLKTEFFADASHELRTPLSLVVLALRLLRIRHPKAIAGAPEAYVTAAERQAAVLLHHVTNLLDVARIEARARELKPRPVRLAPMLDEISGEFSLLAESRGVTLNHVCAPEAAAFADPEKLESIFRNLIFNAIKFTPEGGTVAVRVSAGEKLAELEVSDTGQGIAPEQLATLFERYVRSDRARGGGTGLGLSLAKELVERSGGSISVTSAIGQGTTFKVSLPAAQAEAETSGPHDRRSPLPLPPPASAAEHRPEPEAHQRPAILVIEDHRELRELLSDSLAPHFEIAEAGTAAAGIELARQKLPAVIVCDVMLPDRSGFEIVRELRGSPQTAQIPIILLTANAALDVKLEGLEAGAVDLLGKPFSLEELLARIRVQLRIRNLVSEVAQAQKSALLTSLADGLAHEIRNPMNAILNSVSLIRKSLKAGTAGESADVAMLLGIIEESAQGAAELTNSVVALKHADRSGRWDPSSGLEAVLGVLAPRLNRVSVQRELAFRGAIEGHAGELNQVLLHLVDNAVRAAPAGKIWISTQKRADRFVLSVRDDGPGIAPAIRERIFDPFFTTRDADGRTGLGLHLCKMIAESHRGSLEVESAPGAGATFILDLPLTPGIEA